MEILSVCLPSGREKAENRANQRVCQFSTRPVAFVAAGWLEDDSLIKTATRRRKTMGNRLSKIYTRTGDQGTTGLGDGSRVAKNSLRIHAIGEIDELNAVIGLLRCETLPKDIQPLLAEVQHTLFDLGGEICIPGSALVSDRQVEALEAALDRFNADLKPLKDFILPGGVPAAAQAHHARTVCRRAERSLVTLSQQEDNVRAETKRYLNRLSDLLFVLGRAINQAAGCGDVLWQKNRRD